MTSVSKIINYTSDNFILCQRQVSANSPFSANISGTPSSTTVVYTNDSNEGMFGVHGYLSMSFGHIMLYNETRGNYRKIADIDPDTNTFTTVASTDDWADGDKITTSNPVLGLIGISSPRYFLVDVSEEVPSDATWIIAMVGMYDGSTLPRFKLHPAEEYNASKRQEYYTQVAGVFYSAFFWLPLVNQKFALSYWSGFTSTTVKVMIYGYVVEEDMPTKEEIADAVWDEAIADHTASGTFGAKNQKVVPSESVNDYKADVSSLALETTAQAIKTQTDKMQFDGSNNIQSRVNDKGVLNDPSAIDIDTQLSSTHGSGSWEGSTPEEVADAVWDEAISDHTADTTFGGKNQRVVPSETIDDYKADVSGLAPAHEYDTEMSYIPPDLSDVPTMSELNASHGSGSWEGASASDIDTQLSATHGSGSWEGSSASDVASAVWNEDLSGHTTPGTAGKIVNSIKKLVEAILAFVT